MRWIPAIVVAPIIPGALLAGRAGPDGELLIATVGTNDGFDIALRYPDGRMVDELVPGTYTVRVRDLSRLHNFHLASNTDPTVDFRTDVEFVGEQDFTVTFKNGIRYAYACEPHWQTMNGEFLVRAAAPQAPPPPPPPAVRTLRASVSPTGVATLTPRSARNGRVRVVMRERGRAPPPSLLGRWGTAGAGPPCVTALPATASGWRAAA